MHRPSPARLLSFLLACGLALCGNPASSQDQAAVLRQLEELQAQISELDHARRETRSRQSELRAKLQETEKALGTLQRQLANSREAIAATGRELATLEKRQQKLQAQRDAQRARLASELETAWKMGRQEQLKVLLSQQEPHRVARTMTYYRYLLAARQERVAAFRATLDELSGVQRSIEDRQTQLAARQAELEGQRRALDRQQQVRSETIAALAEQLADQEAKLARMQADRRELETLLETIERAVVNMRLPEDYQAFAEVRGKMAWPVEGKPSNRFGRARNAGKMRWQGVNLPASAGATVRAIHHGRVVYADWFRGSGLLLIIDHGDGFMSLYAHNQSLLREVGEWVNAGAAIATVGSSGGLESPALYFEIRHNGKPVDPAVWIHG